MGKTIDETDLQIIKELKENPEQSFNEIAGKLKLAHGTVYNRVGKLRRMGVIRSFSAVIDQTKLGYGMTALINVTTRRMFPEKLTKKLREKQEITAAYGTTGTNRILLVARFRDAEDLNGFIKELETDASIKETSSEIVIKTIKES